MAGGLFGRGHFPDIHAGFLGCLDLSDVLHVLHQFFVLLLPLGHCLGKFLLVSMVVTGLFLYLHFFLALVNGNLLHSLVIFVGVGLTDLLVLLDSVTVEFTVAHPTFHEVLVAFVFIRVGLVEEGVGRLAGGRLLLAGRLLLLAGRLLLLAGGRLLLWLLTGLHLRLLPNRLLHLLPSTLLIRGLLP